MSAILFITSVGGPPDSEGQDGAASRQAQLLAALASGGHNTLLLTPAKAGLEIGEALTATPLLAWIRRPGQPQREVYSPEELHALLAELAPEGLVALGASAAQVAVWLAGDLPIWVDLADQVLPATAADPFDRLWRMLPFVDRADRFSCATEVERQALSGFLGLRGRLDGERPGWEQVVTIPPNDGESQGVAILCRWILRPRRAEPRTRSLAIRLAETEARNRVLTKDLERFYRSWVWRVWSVFRSLSDAVVAALAQLRQPGRLLERWGRAVWSGLVWLYLFVLTGWQEVFARFRRAGLRNAAHQALLQPLPLEAPVGGRRPRVLIVCPYPIWPANHGGAVRLYNLIKLLSADCDLYLLIFIRSQDDPGQRAALEPWCRAVYFHHWTPSFEPALSNLAPPSARIFASPRVEQRIREIVRTFDVDVVQLEYTEMAQYLPAGMPVKVILVEHDIAFRSFWRRRNLGFAERFPDSRAFGATFGDWMRLQRYEVAACRAVDQVHVMSAQDAGFLAAYLGDGLRRIRVVPNAVDTAWYRAPDPAPEREGVLLVGNFQNLPNLDAFEYFMAEIWPRVRERRPKARLTVVGAKMPERLHEFDGGHGVTIVGTVPDMRPYYHTHRVLAVPLRAGSGTRLKLFEAFAAGIPAVSTTLGAEGIDYQAGTHLLLADTPEDFADAIERLLADDDLHARLAEEALRLAEDKYDWSFAARHNLEGIRELLAEKRSQEAEGRPGGTAPVQSAPKLEAEGKPAVEVSIVIPTLDGGAKLEQCLEAIARQKTSRSFEVICVDSGSPAADIAMMRRHGARVEGIAKRDFNHGLTRDLGASLTGGEVLVFLNQDAVPRDADWLERITRRLFSADPPAAVQGGILEFPHESGVARFFWDSCGERFYFTRESDRWIRHFSGLGFSTVNAAIRRSVWESIPFGWAPIMEDKKWQREVIEAGYRIEADHEAAVYHTHDYDLRSLSRRCESEGYGWRLLGETYSFLDMLKDMLTRRNYGELRRGLLAGRVRKPAELLFPWLRPWKLFVGNQWSRDVRL